MSEITRIDNIAVSDTTEEVNSSKIEEYELGARHTESELREAGADSHRPVFSLPKTDLGNFLQRLTKIKTQSLVTTDFFTSQIFDIDPWALFLTDTVIASKIKDYRYLFGTLDIEVSVNVPAGCYGLYYLIAVPFGGEFDSAVTAFGASVDDVECLPHIKIDLANSTKGSMRLPWNNWNDYFDLRDTSTPDGYEKNWFLRLYCYYPLTQGNGSTVPTATMVVYARCCDDVDLVIPFQQGKFDDTRKNLNNKITKATGGVKASSVMSGVAGLAGMASKIPVIGALATPIQAGATAVSSLLDFFGFTRKTDERPPMPIMNRPYSNVANMDGFDTGEVAAMSVTNELSIDPFISNYTNQDQSSFEYMCEKYILIGQVDWTTAQTNNTTLIEFPVTPFISRDSIDVGARFPVVGFLGFPFEYWRCDMEYLLHIPISKFHRGVLQISWSPSGAAAADVTNNQMNHIVDITTSQSIEFDVGYASPLACLQNFPVKFNDTIVTGRGVNGAVKITVVNPLTSPVATANTKIFIFARGKRPQFSAPRTVARVWNGTSHINVDFATSFQLQGGALGDDNSVIEHFSLVPSTPSYPMKEVCSGEDIGSVRALMQKFSRDYNISRILSDGAYKRVLVPHLPIWPTGNQHLTTYPNAPSVVANQCFNWFGYYSALFVGIASSTRYKVMNTSDRPYAFGASHFNTFTGANFTSNLTTCSISTVDPVWIAADGAGVEITVPYYFNRKWLPTMVGRAASTILDGTNTGRLDILEFQQQRDGETINPSAVVYTAGGPDIRYHMFRCPRVIKLNTGGAATPVFGNLAYVPPGFSEAESNLNSEERLLDIIYEEDSTGQRALPVDEELAD